MSEEASVMGVEQRGGVIQFCESVNQRWEEPMDKTKPFEISKQVVWKAYKRVKANQGAVGIDEESIAQFEENLKDNLYNILESPVVGDLFSSSGQGGSNTEEERREEDSGNPDGCGPNRPDGGEDLLRAGSGAAFSGGLLRL
jgi:hypothetical protein